MIYFRTEPGEDRLGPVCSSQSPSAGRRTSLLIAQARLSPQSLLRFFPIVGP